MEEKVNNLIKEKEALIEEINKNKSNDFLKGEALKAVQFAIQTKDEEAEKWKQTSEKIAEKLKNYLLYPQIFKGNKGTLFKSSITISFRRSNKGQYLVGIEISDKKSDYLVSSIRMSKEKNNKIIMEYPVIFIIFRTEKGVQKNHLKH